MIGRAKILVRLLRVLHPLIYVNENSNTWDIFADIEYKEVSKFDEVEPTIPITDENKIVDILMAWWTKKYPMTEGSRNQNCPSLLLRSTTMVLVRTYVISSAL